MKKTIDSLKYLEGFLEDTILKGKHKGLDFTIGFREDCGTFEVDGYKFSKINLKLLEDALRMFIFNEAMESEAEEEKRQSEIDYWSKRGFDPFADRGISERDFL